MKNINCKGQKDYNLPFGFLISILKFETMLLTIVLGFIFIFNTIPDRNKFIIKYNVEKTFCFNTKNYDINYQDLLEKNSNIESENKDFILSVFEKEIEENINYIDSDCLKRLQSFKISYYNYIDNNVLGSYNAVFNRINLYDCDDFYSLRKEVYTHEINHLITKDTLSTNISMLANKLDNNNSKFASSFKLVGKNIFSEVINELFTREYLDETSCIYEDYMVYAYILAEILPEDIIRKYKFNDNECILIDGFLEIDNNIDKVFDLFSAINTSDYPEIYNGFSYFYEKKYGQSMSDNIVILSYLYNTPLNQNNKLENVLGLKKDDTILKITPKGYFSKEYKEKYPIIQIEYTKGGKYFTTY